MASVSRRAFLAIAVLFAPATALRAFARQPRPALVSLDEFLDLSGRLLGQSKLDREIGQLYLDALTTDHDTALHLANLAQSNGNPTPEQAALSQTILECWYTGVYTVDGKPRVATYTGALMWSAVGRTAPGTCTGTFGSWSQPPSAIA